MAWKPVLFLCVLIYVSTVYAKENSDVSDDEVVDRAPKKRQAFDTLTSSEIQQRRIELERQLDTLNQRRRHRYDKDRKCCEQNIEVNDNDSPCCERVQKQKCPHREEKRCGLPKTKPVVRKYTRIVPAPPSNFKELEQQLLTRLDTDLRSLNKDEEERWAMYERQRRTDFESELRREQTDEESWLATNEQNRRKVFDDEVDRLIREKRQAFEEDLRVERENSISYRKKRHDERILQLENDLREQKKRDLEKLDVLVEQRRREFDRELRELSSRPQQGSQVIEEEEIVYEPVPEEYESVRQNCCYRCAGQSCGNQNCPFSATGDCPKKCDRCRCNHSFISCPGINK